MRCRECAAEVAVTARVCSRCGAPIVGQPPVVADTVVADTVVAAVSDAAGKAVPAGVAGQALPEPYVPGSGDRVPAELRLVLAGYAGIAGGLSLLRALACATALVFFFFFTISTSSTGTAICTSCCSPWPSWRFLGGFRGGWAGAREGVHALQARIRFSRLLRRPSDPRTATVMASKRGGRTLILDIIPGDGTGRRYQSLSEVRLALWLKAGMLVPGETVNVYGGSGGRERTAHQQPPVGQGIPRHGGEPVGPPAQTA